MIKERTNRKQKVQRERYALTGNYIKCRLPRYTKTKTSNVDSKT